MTISNDRLTIDRFSFVLRLDTLFPPFSIEELTPGLETLGYTLTDEIIKLLSPGATPVGSRIGLDGHIAIKADPPLQVRINTGRGILGVDGKNVDEVIEDYILIEEWLNKELALDLGHQGMFYEFILEGLLTVGRDRSPIETLRGLYSSGDLMGQFAAIVGRDVTNYGIRLVDKGRAPTDQTWFDLRIEPSVQRSESSYRINTVSRGPELQAQAEEARQLSDKLRKLVAAMETDARSR